MRLIFIFSIFFTLQTANAYMVKTTDYSGQHKHILSFKMDFNDRLKPTESSKGVILKVDGSTYYLFKNQLLNEKKEVLCDFQDPSLKVAPKKNYIKTLSVSSSCPVIEDFIFIDALNYGGAYTIGLDYFNEVLREGNILFGSRKVEISLFGEQVYNFNNSGMASGEEGITFYDRYQKLSWKEKRIKLYRLPIESMIDEWSQGKSLNLLGYLLNKDDKKENSEKMSFRIKWLSRGGGGLITSANLESFKFKSVLFKVMKQHFKLMRMHEFFQVPGGMVGAMCADSRLVYYVNDSFVKEVDIRTDSYYQAKNHHTDLILNIKINLEDAIESPFGGTTRN